MLVRASVHATRPIPQVGKFDPENLPIMRNVIALGTIRQRRELRRAAIIQAMSDASVIDAIIPGLSEMKPGPANDALRAYRYSLRQMGATPVGLRAALVAARYRCWIALHR